MWQQQLRWYRKFKLWVFPEPLRRKWLLLDILNIRWRTGDKDETEGGPEESVGSKEKDQMVQAKVKTLNFLKL